MASEDMLHQPSISNYDHNSVEAGSLAPPHTKLDASTSSPTSVPTLPSLSSPTRIVEPRRFSSLMNDLLTEGLKDTELPTSQVEPLEDHPAEPEITPIVVQEKPVEPRVEIEDAQRVTASRSRRGKPQFEAYTLGDMINTRTIPIGAEVEYRGYTANLVKDGWIDADESFSDPLLWMNQIHQRESVPLIDVAIKENEFIWRDLIMYNGKPVSALEAELKANMDNNPKKRKLEHYFGMDDEETPKKKIKRESPRKDSPKKPAKKVAPIRQLKLESTPGVASLETKKNTIDEVTPKKPLIEPSQQSIISIPESTAGSLDSQIFRDGADMEVTNVVQVGTKEIDLLPKYSIPKLAASKKTTKQPIILGSGLKSTIQVSTPKPIHFNMTATNTRPGESAGRRTGVHLYRASHSSRLADWKRPKSFANVEISPRDCHRVCSNLSRLGSSLCRAVKVR